LHEEFVREDGWYRNLSGGGNSGETGGMVTGKVAAISDDEIRIIPDSQLTAALELGEDAGEFVLRAPVRGVSVGDEVRIEFRNDQDRRIALRVVELSHRQ
jgi:hypothetical protein